MRIPYRGTEGMDPSYVSEVWQPGSMETTVAS